jgi:hypothetical protein
MFNKGWRVARPSGTAGDNQSRTAGNTTVSVERFTAKSQKSNLQADKKDKISRREQEQAKETTGVRPTRTPFNRNKTPRTKSAPYSSVTSLSEAAR